MKRWIRVGMKGGRRVAVCDVCGKGAQVPTQAHLSAFSSRHASHESAQEGWMGAGDVVAAAASRLGIEACTPCEKRRRRMNKMAPKFWKR